MVVVHRGRLVAERYAPGFGPETRQISWSMAKSITSALVGRAVKLGLIDNIDEAMPSSFKDGDPRAEITWRQWLNMTDGLNYTEIGEADLQKNDVVQMMFGSGKYDVLAYVRDELPKMHEPGTVWNYSTAGYHVISGALEQVYVDDLRKRLSMAADPVPEPAYPTATERLVPGVLLERLGMNTQPEFDPTGTFLGGSLVWASPRDFAKFGYLYLRDGMWKGTRLLPEGWVDFSRTKSPANNVNVYGAGWWITAYGEERSHRQNAATPPWDAFHAGGNEGQTIWVVPSRDLVIVRLGIMPNSPENWEALYEWNQSVARTFPEVKQ